MRINGPGRTGGVAGQGKTKGAGSSGGAFRLDAPQQTQAAASTQTLNSIGNIDSILAVQGVEDPSSRRKKAVKRGSDLLDILDEIKLDILAGEVPRAKLEQLVRVISQRRDGVSDSQLQGVLDEVELRARVELAKFGYYQF
mgnify:CR=1 FL=1